MREPDAGPAGLEPRAGGVRFDAESGELAGPLGSTRLAPQPAALLELLRHRAGTVVDRERIRNHLWPGGRVEFDQGIAFAVREIRKALDAVGADPHMVETLPKRGLRLRAEGGVEPIQPRDRSAGDGDVAPTAPMGQGSTAPRAARTGGGRSRTVAAVIALLAVMATALLWPIREPAVHPVVAITEYASADGQPRPAVGLGQVLTVTLTRGLDGRAGVIGPAGTAVLAGPDDTEGARIELGACLLLSGSLRQVGTDRLVVFTQIVRTSDRTHVWAQRDTLRVTDEGGRLAGSVLAATRAALDDC